MKAFEGHINKQITQTVPFLTLADYHQRNAAAASYGGASYGNNNGNPGEQNARGDNYYKQTNTGKILSLATFLCFTIYPCTLNLIALVFVFCSA